MGIDASQWIGSGSSLRLFWDQMEAALPPNVGAHARLVIPTCTPVPRLAPLTSRISGPPESPCKQSMKTVREHNKCEASVRADVSFALRRPNEHAISMESAGQLRSVFIRMARAPSMCLR